MSDPYIGEIRMIASNFAPAGWAMCDGQLLPIAQFDTVFGLIGTQFGGDGVNNFALPDLRGRVPMHLGAVAGGSARAIGETGGSETVTLTTQEIPSHAHGWLVSTDPAGAEKGGAQTMPIAEVGGPISPFGPTTNTELHPSTIAPAGGSQPHQNMMPFLAITFVIALEGIYPPRP